MQNPPVSFLQSFISLYTIDSAEIVLNECLKKTEHTSVSRWYAPIKLHYLLCQILYPGFLQCTKKCLFIEAGDELLREVYLLQ